jgi:hypothetical protein
MKPLFINVGLATTANVERAIKVAEALGYSYGTTAPGYLSMNYPAQPVAMLFRANGQLDLHGQSQGVIPYIKTETVQLDLGPLNDTVTIRLNDSYSAVLEKDHVQVGCQKFSNAVILQLAEAIKQNQ